MKTEKNRSSDPPPPIPLEYCGTDLPSDFRREADAMAADFGGWAQIGAAVGFGAAGALFGWLWFQGNLGCFSMFLGVAGFCIGLFVPLPVDRDQWQRLCVGMICGAIGLALGLCVQSRSLTVIFCISGYKAGVWLADWADWSEEDLR